MGSKTLFFQVETSEPIEKIQDAAVRAFMPLGGQINKIGNDLQISQGKEGVQFGFSADFDATVIIRETSQQKYELLCTVNWKMNTLSIICLVVGFFIFGILWIIPILSLFVDPTSSYNMALYSIPNFLKRDKN